jgi:putative ABC transport system ATP-binding protein
MILQAERIGMVFRNGRIETPVLWDIDLDIAPVEFVAVMGPSGCGKSTLMHILGLMLTPTTGKVFIDGLDTTQISPAHRAALRRDKIGFVFQRFNLLPTLNVYQNIAVAQRIRRRPLDGHITAALESVGMADFARRTPGQLSIGQQQRIAVARAICHQPAVLFADEPTGNLDSRNADNVLTLFRDVHRHSGVTVVMITHSPDAAKWADRIIHIADGRISNA